MRTVRHRRHARIVWPGAPLQPFRIEREGVAEYLDLRPAACPPTQSACAHARWDYDGAQLAFHGTLPPTTSRVAVIPLTYRLTR